MKLEIKVDRLYGLILWNFGKVIIIGVKLV